MGQIVPFSKASSSSTFSAGRIYQNLFLKAMIDVFQRFAIFHAPFSSHNDICHANTIYVLLSIVLCVSIYRSRPGIRMPP